MVKLKRIHFDDIKNGDLITYGQIKNDIYNPQKSKFLIVISNKKEWYHWFHHNKSFKTKILLGNKIIFWSFNENWIYYTIEL